MEYRKTQNQKLIDSALGRDHFSKSNRQRSAMLKWLPLEQDIQFATAKMAYKILNEGVPEELAIKGPMNKNGKRIQDQRKCGQKPKWLNQNALAKSTRWNRLYFYNTLPKNLTMQQTLKKLKERSQKTLPKPHIPKMKNHPPMKEK